MPLFKGIYPKIFVRCLHAVHAAQRNINTCCITLKKKYDKQQNTSVVRGLLRDCAIVKENQYPDILLMSEL